MLTIFIFSRNYGSGGFGSRDYRQTNRPRGGGQAGIQFSGGHQHHAQVPFTPFQYQAQYGGSYTQANSGGGSGTDWWGS